MATRRTKSTRRAAGRRTTTRRATTRRTTTRSKVQRPWSREEMAFMRKFYRRYETSWIAKQLGRTVYSVRYKAVDMNLKKANPSVWRGNTGSANAFTKTAKGRKPAARRTAKRRTTSAKSWKATQRTTRKGRRTTGRKTRRTR